LTEEYKKKNNVVPISEFNVKVYEIVKHSPVPFIYSILGEKYNHYLVDEFQDTSRLQWENLFPLIDNAMGSGFFSMAVGDGKQSIYRWRGGDVEIMEADIKKKILAEQLAVKPLDKNFRSKENIVTFNNRFFEKVNRHYKKESILLEGIYSDISQVPVHEKGGFVSLQLLEETNAGVEKDLPVFERIETIIQNCRSLGYKDDDIAILVRENRKGQEVAGFLLEKKIPVVSPDSLSLAKIPLTRFLIDILTYLSNPADKIAEAGIIFFLALNKQPHTGQGTGVTAADIGNLLLEEKGWDLAPELTEFFRRKEYL
ncbi:MAG: UvrD-helicase domain-containing protein, partial [bacterium]|nr:UvrD-helicase domain-containing protein [bacterium]